LFNVSLSFYTLVGSSVRIPDDSKPITDTLRLIEQEVLKIFETNAELYKKDPMKYESIFKQVRKKRKKARNDRSQPLMIAEQEAKARRNLRKMTKKNSAVVFKGKPLVFRARKKVTILLTWF